MALGLHLGSLSDLFALPEDRWPTYWPGVWISRYSGGIIERGLPVFLFHEALKERGCDREGGGVRSRMEWVNKSTAIQAQLVSL